MFDLMSTPVNPWKPLWEGNMRAWLSAILGGALGLGQMGGALAGSPGGVQPPVPPSPIPPGTVPPGVVPPAITSHYLLPGVIGLGRLLGNVNTRGSNVAAPRSMTSLPVSAEITAGRR